MGGPTNDRDDAILAQLRQEFLTDARDRLDKLQPVAAARAIGKIVAREPAARGHRVTIARTPREAFELAVCTQPDLLITSVVPDRVSGVGIVRLGQDLN